MNKIKLTLKLREDCPPHLFITQIKKLMEKDKSLHKDMKNLLLYLKKTKQSYVPLSHVQEVIIDFDKFLNFQRGIEPQISAWVRKEMDEEEKEDYKENPKKYLKGLLNLYNSMGYDFYNQEEVTEEFIESLIKITEPSKKNKMRFLKKK